MTRSIGCLSTLVVAGFVAGYLRPAAEAHAAPVACTKWECKTVHASWSAGNGVVAFFLQVGGGDANDAYNDIFAVTSTEKQPHLAGAAIAEWSYDACDPHCDLIGGVWPSIQEVSIPAGAQRVGVVRNHGGYICTGAGGVGPKSKDQKNDNPDGKIPPPVKKDQG